jgi:hypothetical protein
VSARGPGCLNDNRRAPHRETFRIPLDAGRPDSLATRSKRFQGDQRERPFRASIRAGVYFSFALFPLILLMMTLFGMFATRRVELQNDLLSYFEDFLPPEAFEPLARNASRGKLTLVSFLPSDLFPAEYVQ